MKPLLYVGTYSHPDCLGGDTGFAGRAEGLYVMAFDEAHGTLELARIHRGIVNPSYLALNAAGDRLYCVHELDTWQGKDSGAVSAYAIGDDGSLALLSHLPSHGAAPCHVALSAGGARLAVSNYTGGSLCLYNVRADGSIAFAYVAQHAGHGPNEARQASAHVHSAWFVPDGDSVVAADLGLDALVVYKAATPGQDAAFIPAEPEDGPRMMAYHPGLNLLYVANELACTIAAYACDAQGNPQRRLWAVPTLAHAPGPGDTAADLRISMDGRFLYASTRGADSLTVFAIGDADGTLAPVQRIASGGRVPRAFALSPSGRWLLCGHQESDTIAIFAVDMERGTLTPHGETAVPSPVCLVFAP